MEHSRSSVLKPGRVLHAIIAIVVLSVLVVPVFAQEGQEEVNNPSLPNIVLVHGGWADGASWSGVIQQLQAKGYNVKAPQFVLASVQEDAQHLRQILNSWTVIRWRDYDSAGYRRAKCCWISLYLCLGTGYW